MFRFKILLNFFLLFNCLLFFGEATPLPEGSVAETLISLNSSEEAQLYKSDDDDSVDLRSALFKSRIAADWPIYDERFHTLPSDCATRGIPLNCAEATACTKRSGYYYIKFPRFDHQVVLVECDAVTNGGNWTVIQKRFDGSVDFYRTWSEYKSGFGNMAGEHFIGLDKLHDLTNFHDPQELLIVMEHENLTLTQVRYDSFIIGDESEKYILKDIGNYTGKAGNALRVDVGNKFSTKDQDNDSSTKHCAQERLGAWWYNTCSNSNLNGHYGDTRYEKGANWLKFTGDYNSLKTVKMMIRRRT